MSLSSDGFWLSVSAYKAPACASCDEGIAVDVQGDCCRCHWKAQAEVEDCWPAWRSYLANWSAVEAFDATPA